MYLSELIEKAQKEITNNGDKEIMISVIYSDGKKLIGGMDNIELINHGNHIEVRGEQV